MAQTESANKTVNISSNNNSVVNKTLAEYVHVLNSKAIAFFYTGNFEEAIALSDQALAIDPNDVDALNSKAHALIGMGEYNQAIAFFDKVLAIDPNNIDGS
jgi:tetratricopeptide (TPR) repeat protein